MLVRAHLHYFPHFTVQIMFKSSKELWPIAPQLPALKNYTSKMYMFFILIFLSKAQSCPEAEFEPGPPGVSIHLLWPEMVSCLEEK